MSKKSVSLAASVLGRSGGQARAKALTKAERVVIAKKGGAATKRKFQNHLDKA